MAKEREKALDSEYAIRRVMPIIDCWRPHPESRMTSQAFSDRKGEPSIDLYTSLLQSECEKVRHDNSNYIQDGFGLAHAQVTTIRQLIKENNFDGDVVRDPLPDNPRHGVISGKLTDAKRKALSQLFSPNVCVVPDPQKYLAAQMAKKQSNL